MNHRARNALIVILWTALMGAGLWYWSQRQSVPTSAAHSTSLDPKSRYANEEHWIVSSVCEDIARIAGFGNEGFQVTPIPQTSEFEVTGKGAHSAGRFSLPLEDFVWAPAVYVPIAKGILAVSPAGEPSREALKNLLRPTAQNLERENRRVSASLATNPGDPAAHEEAALLLSALALREAAHNYYDTRRLLSRMAAHLAIALVPETPHGSTGRMADLALRVLCGREVEAAAAISGWRDDATPEESAWLNALELRNSGDWRILKNPTEASLLERLEFFRALANQVSTEKAEEFLRQLDAPEEIPDWSLMILEERFSVQQGHVFTKYVLALELDALSQVLGPVKSLDAAAELLTATRNSTSGKEEVIDRETWGRFFERHIFHAISQTDVFMRDRWASPEAAAQFEKQTQPLASRLTLHPLLRQSRARTQREYDEAMAAAGVLVAQHPELVTAANWYALRESPLEMRYAHVVPLYDRWFEPDMPRGTVYNPRGRLRLYHLWSGPLARLEPWRKLAPAQHDLAAHFARKSERPMNPSRAKEVWGPLVEYNLRAMVSLAESLQSNPEEYQRIMRNACALDPGMYLQLGAYLVSQNREAEAAEAYQKAVDLASDRVQIANSCGWLVDYYFDHGQKDKALEIAKMAAEVYSHAGLQTMAALQERMDNLDVAEEYHDKVYERYSDRSGLIGLYYRNADKNAGYRKRLDAALAAEFPQGLREASLDSFSGAPSAGVIIRNTSRLLENNGLARDAIIVALDGWRTDTLGQYNLIREWDPSSPLRLIVWQNGRYSEISADVPGRRFGVEIESYAN